MTLTVGLVQVNMELTWEAARPGSEDAAESGPAFALLPYSVAMLQSYAQAHASCGDQLEFLPPVYLRMPVDEAVERLLAADVVGLSMYVWNERISLEIARRLKERRPDVLVVAGGPQVPDDPTAWLQAHPWVDLACHGEGEAMFAEVLDRAAHEGRGAERAAFAGIAGVSYVADDGDLVTHPPRARMRDLDSIPSPMLAGTYDAILDDRPRDRWVAMWETNRGCPFSCAFCDWGGATQSKVNRFGMERVLDEVRWFGEQGVRFVFCCDANFGMLPRDVEIAEAVVAEKRRSGAPTSLSVQNTKNATDRAYRVQTLIAQELDTIGVTISLQSTSPDTLAAIRRSNISSESFGELQRRYSRDGVYTFTDLILGLPGETYDAFADGVAEVIAGGQHNHVQFHDCSVLPNAAMGDPEYQRQFGLRTVPQVIRSIHDRAENVDEVPEYLDIVVETDAMPAPDWVRARCFAWVANAFYFNRLLQVPIAVLAARGGVSTRTLVEAVFEAPSPVLTWVRETCMAKARDIQSGACSYSADEATGGILWPMDQYVMLRLFVDGRLDEFWREARVALEPFAGGDAELVQDCVELNRALLRLPGAQRDAWLSLGSNVWEHYSALVGGGDVPLEAGMRMYRVDRTSRPVRDLRAWQEHLIWCSGKDKRAHLHDDVTAMQRPPMLAAIG